MSKTFISVIAGLGGMLGWGTSDFFANNASEKIGNIKTFFWSQVVGLFGIIIFGLIFGLSFSMDLISCLLILVSGIAYAFGYLAFYKAFEIGNVTIVSTTINLGTIIAMLCAYIFLGQRLTNLQFFAIFLIIFGVICVGIRMEDIKNKTVRLATGVKEAILASCIFGTLYWPLNDYILEHVHWITVSLLIKVIALVTVYAYVSLKHSNISVSKTPAKIKGVLISVGILEAVAVLSTNIGMMVGDSILVVPISSALTVVTILLAIIFLKEKINKLQTLGILATIIGILITAF